MKTIETSYEVSVCPLCGSDSITVIINKSGDTISCDACGWAIKLG